MLHYVHRLAANRGFIAQFHWKEQLAVAESNDSGGSEPKQEGLQAGKTQVIVLKEVVKFHKAEQQSSLCIQHNWQWPIVIVQIMIIVA